MRYILTTVAIIATTVVANKRDLCDGGDVDSLGNWYCKKVTAITYNGIGGSGLYDRITNMDPTNGICTSEPHSYSGTLAPLDEEVSMHFRGPLWLKQFAVYTPGSASNPKKARRSAHVRRHGHAHMHAHHEVREAALGDEVVATIDGQVVSWANNWSGQSATKAAAASTATPASDNVVAAAAGAVNDVLGAVTGNSGASDSPNTADSGSSWARQGYYNAEGNISQGLVFLNHMGGAGSGTFDYKFGNSLSYAGSDGTSASDSPVALANATIPSSGEVVIMSDVECSDSNPCPYSRPDTVAYHGFDGPSKVFLYEFQMPDDGQTSHSVYDAINMPAIWMLNAQIPRTLQYGTASCSCWTSGCGEFDIFEVLSPGDTRCKSTLHGNIAGGDSDYFGRPVSAPVFAAVLLYNNNIHIKLYDSLNFDSSLDWSVVEDLINTTSEQNALVSLFSLLGAAGDSSA